MTPTQLSEQRGILTLAHNTYEKNLYSHAFFKISDRLICQDLVQNTFTKTWLYLMRGGKINSMKAFLYHILNCLIVDEYRKRKTESLDLLLDNGFEPSSHSHNTFINFLDGKMAINLISRLPKKYKMIMQMKYVKEMTLEEISQSTGQTRNSVAVQNHRGIEMLKVLYHRV